MIPGVVDQSESFAFVEYESRRDADDAYHEMHNKRIGRDDLLKIEVCYNNSCLSQLGLVLTAYSGLGLPHLLLGALTLVASALASVATVSVATVHHLHVVGLAHLAAGNSRLEKMIDGIETMTAAIEIALEAQTTVIVR